MKFKKYEELYLKNDEFYNYGYTVWLSISNANLSDLNGIERYQTIEHIDLRNNNISDLSPLAELQNLHSINISNNITLDLTPLSKCEKTTSLGLRKIMAIKNLDAIGDMKNLNKLSIMEMVLEDLSFLQKTQPLNEITLSSSFLVNVEGLKGMTALEKLTIINCAKDFFTIENSKTILGIESLKFFNFYSNVTINWNFEKLVLQNETLQLINSIPINKFKARVKYNCNCELLF